MISAFLANTQNLIIFLMQDYLGVISIKTEVIDKVKRFLAQLLFWFGLPMDGTYSSVQCYYAPLLR